MTVELLSGTKLFCAATLFLMAATTAAGQTTFSNSATISIPALGTASPYPSTIDVSGMTGLTGKVTVTLSSYTHTYPGDVGVLLVSPTGASVNLMSRCGGDPNASNVNLTFDDAAAGNLPATIVSGTYRPSQCSSATFSGPAPAAPYGTTLSAVNGTNPNGTWKLYVQDFVNGDSGSFSGGWSLTIESNTNPGALQFSAANYSGNEGASVTVTVTRTNGLSGAVAIDYASSNGSAVGGAACGAGVDYVNASGTLTFAQGVSSQTFTIQLCSDAVADANETINLALSNPTGGASLGTPATATLTITSPAVQFSTANYLGNEGTSATVTVTRAGDPNVAVTVDYATSAGTSTGGTSCGAGVDYVNTSGTLTFGAGVTSRTFSVPLCSDTTSDPGETIQLALTNATGGASLGTPSMAILTITNVPPPTLQFSRTNYISGEGASVFLTVTRTGDPNVQVTVDYAATGGTATAGASCNPGIDYLNTSGTLTLFAGDLSRTITVTVCFDTISDPDETVNFALSNPTGGASLGTPNTAVLTIAPTQVLQFQAASYSTIENDASVTLDVRRSGSSNGTITVNYATSNGTATGGAACGAGVDYVSKTGTLTFANGVVSQDIVVTNCNDAIQQEGNETFTVTLSNPSTDVSVGALNPATVTIEEDDLPPTALTVNSTNDAYDGTCDATHCSLREAIDAAAINNTTINFSPLFNTPRTITPTVDLFIDKSVTIAGPGADKLTISGNNATRVFHIEPGTFNVTISGVRIANGSPELFADGGGIYSQSSGTVSIINSIIANNFVESADGAGLYTQGGTVNVISSTISGNFAEGEGGGIINQAGTVNIVNSTISGNTAEGDGGGIHNRGTLNIVNATIASNSADSGGGIDQFSGTANVENSIIAGNTATIVAGQDVAGTFASQGYNLIGKSDGSTGFVSGTKSDQVGTNAAPLDPLLGPLANNGGPTQTMALLTGSPAIDKGSAAMNPITSQPLATDQRGFIRPFDLPNVTAASGGDSSDIGAFELALLRVISITRVTGGILLQGVGVPSGVHKIQATPSLLQPFDLNPIGTATADANGNFQFTDVTNLPQRFYRAVYP